MAEKFKKRLRLIVQLCWTAVTNGYIKGFAKGDIYTGKLKYICVPGLNCYSCPGALGSCPIGALQNTLGSRNHKFAFYALGFLTVVGACLGRFVCGWLCPFGLVQDLLFKIPFFKKLKKLPGEKILKTLRYAVLALLVIILPVTVLDIIGQGSPWFCKYLCPSGTLGAGIPLVTLADGFKEATGRLFTWKTAVLLVIILLSLLVYRPFCRYLCPLGAIYGFFNRIALYRYGINEERCISCGACQKACKLDIPVWEKPNSVDCIRCGECRKVCPEEAINVLTMAKKKDDKAE